MVACSLVSRPPAGSTAGVMRLGFAVFVLVAATVCAQESRKATFTTERGVKVLRLWGTPHEMGVAQGELLGPTIIEGFDKFVVRSPVVGPTKYNAKVLSLVDKSMAFSADEEAELAGMLEGIQKTVGDKAIVPSLGRLIELRDLKALNTFGDWFVFACSSFSAWGPLTPDGKTITARNFDFMPSAVLESTQMLVARAPAAKDHRRWVTVGFPGLIGVISGMNEDGVGLFVHDVNPSERFGERAGIHSRLLALRIALETTGAENAVTTVNKTLNGITTFMGNNIHVTSPFDGKNNPAGIIEYDGREALHGGTDLRDAAAGEPYVLCTNHYRLRAEPQKCVRYKRLNEGLAEITAKKGTINADTARELMGRITQSGLFSRTLHTIVFFPAEKRFELQLGAQGLIATKSAPVAFTLAELMPARP